MQLFVTNNGERQVPLNMQRQWHLQYWGVQYEYNYFLCKCVCGCVTVCVFMHVSHEEVLFCWIRTPNTHRAKARKTNKQPYLWVFHHEITQSTRHCQTWQGDDECKQPVVSRHWCHHVCTVNTNQIPTQVLNHLLPLNWGVEMWQWKRTMYREGRWLEGTYVI